MDEIDDTFMRDQIGREVSEAIERILSRIDDPVLAAKMAGQAAEVAIGYAIAFTEPLSKLPKSEAECVALITAVMEVLTEQMVTAVAPAMAKKYGITV